MSCLKHYQICHLLEEGLDASSKGSGVDSSHNNNLISVRFLRHWQQRKIGIPRGDESGAGDWLASVVVMLKESILVVV